MLTRPNIPAGSNLGVYGAGNLITTYYTGPSAPLAQYALTSALGTGITCLNDASTHPVPAAGVPYIGFFFGTYPISWIYNYTTTASPPVPHQYLMFPTEVTGQISSNPATATTYTVRYQDPSGNWVVYDEKYAPANTVYAYPYFYCAADAATNGTATDNTHDSAIGTVCTQTTVDPRSRRFGVIGLTGRGGIFSPNVQPAGTNEALAAAYKVPNQGGSVTAYGSNSTFFVDQTNNVLASDRPCASCGFSWAVYSTLGLPSVGGWFPNPATNWLLHQSPVTGTMFFQPGMLSQNNPKAISDGNVWQEAPPIGQEGQYYSDPDGVVRRAMGAYVPSAANAPATPTLGSGGTYISGLPMAQTISTRGNPIDTTPSNRQSQSRPIILNRPFRSVAELGYVFSGTPWKNLDMFTPESGAAALLDVFCIQEDDNPSPVVAGKVDLNTRQAPVLQAVLAGSYADELGLNPTLPPMTATEAASIANALITRTTSTVQGKGPLANIAELVGKFQSPVPLSGSDINGDTALDGSASYAGFSDDLTSVYGSGSLADPNKNNIERFREAAIRPLASVGTARVWNLLIDLVAQTGRYPKSAAKLSDFVVDGQTRYWLHVAIDRETGQVIDQHLEIVNE
jgi:hypothetical protein